MFAQYFEYYGIILGGRFFVDTLYLNVLNLLYIQEEQQHSHDCIHSEIVPKTLHATGLR